MLALDKQKQSYKNLAALLPRCAAPRPERKITINNIGGDDARAPIVFVGVCVCMCVSFHYTFFFCCLLPDNSVDGATGRACRARSQKAAVQWITARDFCKLKPTWWIRGFESGLQWAWVQGRAKRARGHCAQHFFTYSPDAVLYTKSCKQIECVLRVRSPAII